MAKKPKEVKNPAGGGYVGPGDLKDRNKNDHRKSNILAS